MQCLVSKLKLLIGDCVPIFPAECGHLQFVGDAKQAGSCFGFADNAVETQKLQGKGIDRVVIENRSDEVGVGLVLLDFVVVDDEVLLAILEEVVSGHRANIAVVESGNGHPK